MNSVGQMWRAFDLMVERLLTREVHGGLLKDKQFMQGFVADSYMDLQAARLMTIHAAEKVDKGDPQARTEISAIKVFVPAAYIRVVDRAIQVWGAAGVTSDLPRAQMYLGARTLRLADGPDEVHRILIAKNVLHHYEKGESWDFAGGTRGDVGGRPGGLGLRRGAVRWLRRRGHRRRQRARERGGP